MLVSLDKLAVIVNNTLTSSVGVCSGNCALALKRIRISAEDAASVLNVAVQACVPPVVNPLGACMNATVSGSEDFLMTWNLLQAFWYLC